METTSKITAVLEQSMTAEVNEENKDLIAFGMSIDFTPLFQAISKKLGLVQTLEFSTPRLYERHGGFYVDCESVNIADRGGVLTLALDEVRITFFSNRVTWDIERGRHVFWVIINFSCHQIVGESNELGFALAWFNNEEGWTFKLIERQNR